MSTIIKKKDLDLVVENTLKEAGLATEEENSKPDFLDLDGDGDEEESMKKASKDKEENDSVNESVNNLVDEMNKETVITEGLSKSLDEFKRFANYKLG